jgi:hypothetical protein
VPLSNFVPRGFGFVHHSIAILYHQEPNPNLTIRNFFIAVWCWRCMGVGGQVAVWRCAERRVLVLAFRGTEMAKWKDIVTDANFAPAGFTEERVGGADSPTVHSGFLEVCPTPPPCVHRRVVSMEGIPEVHGRRCWVLTRRARAAKWF